MAKGHFKWKNTTLSLTYNSWRSMRGRCYSDSYSHCVSSYKDKGITVCSEWKDDFDKFYEDMGKRPCGTTLDRINSDGNYELSNCRWATHREQQNNKKSLIRIEHDGQCKTIGEWAYDLDLTPTELSRTYKRRTTYNCTTFDELFYNGSLLTKRVNERINLCLICNRTESIKWRKYGDLCNTCYHKALRWSKRTQSNIETFPDWKGIQWTTKYC